MARLLFALFVITSVILTANCEEVKEGWRNGYSHVLPFAVSIQYSIDGSKFNHFCTGSIIKTKYILTSASCFDGIDDNAKVAVNVGVKEHHDEKGQFINVQKVMLHPEYTKADPLKKFDIAVLELQDPIKFKREAQSIKLPSKDLVAEGRGELVGWNGLTTKTQKTISEKVYIASVSILSSEDCMAAYPDLTTQQFCVAGVNIPDAPCKGTAGIPFGQPFRGFSITGLASIWPDNCEGPALFTSVSPFLDFVQAALSNKLSDEDDDDE